jgi:hypothetical protein
VIPLIIFRVSREKFPRLRQLATAVPAAQHLVTGLHHLAAEAIPLDGGDRRPLGVLPAQQRNPAHGRAAPQRDLRIAMLARDVGVHVLHGDAAAPGD